MSTTSELIHGDPEARYRQVTARVAPSIDPDSGVDIACFMSTDAIDGDNEVMLPDGVDLSRFDKNPVVMLCHASGRPGEYYPLPVGKAEWTKKRPHGLMGGVRFTKTTPMGREVKALFDDDMLRSFSVGFRPIESSPMTHDEAQTRPDWKAAYERTRGRILVHRKWHLLELSVAPIPSNPDALVTRYKSRGVRPPEWLELTPSETPAMDDETTKCMDTPPAVGSHVRHLKSGACGEVTKAAGDDGMSEVDTHDDKCMGTGKMASWHTKDMGAIDGDDGGDDEPEEKSLKPDPETATEEAEEDMPDGDEGEAGKIKRGVHAHANAPHFAGPVMVKGVYRKGLVPDVDNDMEGTRDDPAARVKCYRKMGDGHVPTEIHKAVKVAHLTPMDEPMKSPSKKSAAPVKTKAGVELPPLVELTEQEVLDGAIRKLDVLLQPKSMQEMVKAELDRRMGVV